MSALAATVNVGGLVEAPSPTRDPAYRLVSDWAREYRVELGEPAARDLVTRLRVYGLILQAQQRERLP